MNGVNTAISPSMSLEELEAQITELAGQLNAANYRWLLLIAEFDRRKGWGDGKLPSCAHWLNFKCGLNLGAAREKVRVAHALAGLPKIAASMSRGELSYSKVRALTRVACAATEDSLLMIALHGTAHHVERLVSGFRRAMDAEELSREAQQHANRGLSYSFDQDGSVILKCRLPSAAGVMLLQALDAAIKTLPHREISVKVVEEGALTYQARRADALGVLAESFLTDKQTSGTTADRFQVIVHVDAETLRQGTAGRCELENGPSIPAETARRLACDSSLLRIIENEHGEPLDVGRKTRTIPPAIRRALNTRDAGCRFPGCTHRRYVDAHHIEHWADGGETKLSNLVTLCRLHHRLVHEGEILIKTLPDGGWRFLHPDGRHFEVIRCARVSPNDWQDYGVEPNAAATRWRGERMDYELGVWVLCNQAIRGRRAKDTLVHATHDIAADSLDDVAAETFPMEVEHPEPGPNCSPAASR